MIATTTESMGDKIGVPECDEYIAKYEACIKGKVPEAARAAMQSSFDTARKSWKDMAATTQGKAGLASSLQDSDRRRQTEHESLRLRFLDASPSLRMRGPFRDVSFVNGPHLRQRHPLWKV